MTRQHCLPEWLKFADPLLADDHVPRREIQDMITAARRRRSFIFYQAYRKVRDELEVTAGDGSGVSVAGNPVEKVRAVCNRLIITFLNSKTPRKICGKLPSWKQPVILDSQVTVIWPTLRPMSARHLACAHGLCQSR